MEMIDWKSPDLLELMKKNNDGELSRRLGVSRQRVHQVRTKLGIPSAAARREESVVESGLVGKVTDRELAEKIGEDYKYVAAVRQRLQIKPLRSSKLDDHLHLLGKISDKDLAEMAGTSRSLISTYRRNRNIHPFQDRTTIKN